MPVFRVPVATYRLQFNRAFRFADARNLIPYLHQLGVTDLYSSPLFRARRGSSHGYDVVDPLCINVELGTEKDFDRFVQQLKQHRMGLLLDIVPNHMAASYENPWWRDVLENGPASPYARYFDIDWHPPTTTATLCQPNKILLPVLGEEYETVLAKQELTLRLEEHGFFVAYYDAKFPLDPTSYRPLLQHCLGRWQTSLETHHPAVRELQDLIRVVERLPARETPDAALLEERRKNGEEIKRRLWRLYNSQPEFHRFLNATLGTFPGTKGDARSVAPLAQILNQQAYRLAFWKTALKEINYRRFFDISDLVSLRVEDPEVFERVHGRILQLVKEGKVTGLRIDHIDGLHDPLAYLHRLQSRAAPAPRPQAKWQKFYVIVEKILGAAETLPDDWPAAGTTGYEFLNALNRVFLDPRGLNSLEKTYARFTGSKAPFAEVCYTRKKQAIEQLFTAEVRALARQLGALAARERVASSVPSSELTQALVEVTACLPIYRTYIRGGAVPGRDRAYIERALKAARSRPRKQQIHPSTWSFLRRVLLLHRRKKGWLNFVMRWQQFTGPAMAKGLEDTACYVHNSLLSLNEVGRDPLRQDGKASVQEFHRFNQERAKRWPHTLNATSTHDTKRGEDLRARLNVLSELPADWEKYLERWSRWNQTKKRSLNGRAVPDRNEEVLLYQTLLGAWPLNEEEMPGLPERLQAYAVKAAREAKLNTSWIDPNLAYEAALCDFIESILRASHENRFLPDFVRLQERVAYYGVLNGLAQLLLKIASPGVPDFYQGTELWDLNLVDPDNRRLVDFHKRTQLLEALQTEETHGQLGLARSLLDRWRDGRIKLYGIWKALGFRRAHQEVFLEGGYIPLGATGKRMENVCAFARRQGSAWAVVAVPRLLTRLVTAGKPPLGREVWGTSALRLPRQAPLRWHNALTGEALVASAGTQKALHLGQVFGSFPIALLEGTPE